MSEPSTNPIRQQLQLLLGGYGFNFYSDVNKARSDDLLVRQTASARLTNAAKHIAAIEGDYRRIFVPPSTREQPYPPAETMQALRELVDLKAKIGDAESSLRGMSAPTQDKIWWRFRDELATLQALLSYDKLLIEQADLVQKTAESLTADAWQNDPSAHHSIDPPLSELAATMQLRQRLIQMG